MRLSIDHGKISIGKKVRRKKHVLMPIFNKNVPEKRFFDYKRKFLVRLLTEHGGNYVFQAI
jgi:hypothetical protein